jgi:hypothetical protein
VKLTILYKLGTYEMSDKKDKGPMLSTAEFWEILRQNGGLFQRTANAIEKQYGRTITRQAVKMRAEKRPELLAEIHEINLDKAEGGLFGLMSSASDKVKLPAIKFFLESKGKSRGYVKQVNNALVDKDGENMSFGSFLMKASAAKD